MGHFGPGSDGNRPEKNRGGYKDALHIPIIHPRAFQSHEGRSRIRVALGIGSGYAEDVVVKTRPPRVVVERRATVIGGTVAAPIERPD